MAQMLLEQPMKEARSIGHHIGAYSDLETKLHELREQIGREMHKMVKQYEPDAKLQELILNSIPVEGSYHRGALISIVSESRGNERNISLSATGELFYWATAWLDDISDGNTFRQNTDTMRKTSNDTVAMYLSNAVYGFVMEAIVEQHGTEPAKLSRIFKYFAHNFHVINRGQAKDILMAQRTLESVTIEEYVALIEETTGIDVATNLAIGGIAAGLADETIDKLYQFGLRLGTLAQIRDDVLDYCDVKDDKGKYIIGKLPFRDLETNKKRLPILITKDPTLRKIPDSVYEKIECEYILPRRQEAEKYLYEATIHEESEELLIKILQYWSDIRIFQKLQR
ncbi:hypothetical protein C4573_00090 [Candidatus Woesearchaeota archaeon]|nr:MAG: hypothetical protein C4573_00090 [Candidatus Woesearchaeota archaeon]